LPDVDDMVGDLENYLQTVERAEKFDKKITKIDDLTDKIVTSCTDSPYEEVEIVEEATTG